MTPEQEARLTAERRALLARPDLERAAQVADAAFASEYAWWEEPDETEAVERLGERLRGGQVEPEALVAYAMYRPLAGLDADLAPLASDERLAALIRRQVIEPERERRLAAELPRLTPIRDAASDLVRSHYDSHPYPRWTSLRDVEPVAGPRTVLVAGCGTGRHALLAARRHPDADVLAVDLSARALAYGCRMADELGVANVRFAQADILELRGPRFDRIEAVGVLHHMRDPLAGWRALARMLAPGGTMKLGLYSRQGRAPVRAARDYLAHRGIDDVRAARRALAALPRSHPAWQLTRWFDFATTSSFSDLVLHPVENPLTLPEIEAALDELGLAFRGFDPPPDGAPDRSSTDLREWARFEQANPGAFVAMYRFECGYGSTSANA